MSDIKNYINQSFVTIDFSILPRCVEERVLRLNWDDVEFCIEVMDFLDHYEEFKKTNKSIDRNAQINSYLDMILYIQNHSDIKVEINSKTIDKCLRKKDCVRIMRPFMHLMEQEEDRRKKLIDESSLDVFSDIYESMRILWTIQRKEIVPFESIPPSSDIKKLKDLEDSYTRTNLLEKRFVFVDMIYGTKIFTLRDLYENLSFTEKINIALYIERVLFHENTESERKITVTVNMALFIRAQNIGEIFSKEMNHKHPFLHITSIIDDELRLISFMIENSYDVLEVRKKIFATVAVMQGAEKYSKRDKSFQDKFTYFREKCLETMRITQEKQRNFLEKDLISN